MLDKKRVALRLRDLREQRGLTQDELAERSELSRDTISNSERAVSLPGLDTAEGLRLGLEMPLWELVAFLTEVAERPDPGRHQLEQTLLAAARALSLRDLELAVTQVTLLARHRKGQAAAVGAKRTKRAARTPRTPSAGKPGAIPAPATPLAKDTTP